MRRCETHLIQAGHCRHPEAATLRGGRLSSVVFPALAGLILHPQEGPVLFDTGYDPAFFQATEPFPERFYRWVTPTTLPAGASAAEQFARFGLKPADVRWVVVSHFHGDHIAGLTAFPSAKIACARAGLVSARDGGRWRALRAGVLRGLIPADIDARAVFFEDRPRIALPRSMAPFEAGADLFGDGSVIAVELPGHCPGHWGLLARDHEDRSHFMVGDAAWSSRAIRENRPPPRAVMSLLGEAKAYISTLERLHQVAAANLELVITPAHCLERAAEIAAAKAPP